MFKRSHHKVYEDDGALNVLGGPVDLEHFWSADESSARLGGTGQRERDTAGGDDTELVPTHPVYPGPGGSLEFLAVELLPLRQAIQRLNQTDGGDDSPEE
jgi:hypothetical protein